MTLDLPPWTIPTVAPSREEQRIRFLIGRDGEMVSRAWALDTARTYRTVVLRRHARWRKPGQTSATHAMYRREFIESYLALKAFALSTPMPF